MRNSIYFLSRIIFALVVIFLWVILMIGLWMTQASDVVASIAVGGFLLLTFVAEILIKRKLP
jgi:hypothetical protein